MKIIPYFASPIAHWVTENPFDLKDYCLEIKEKYPVVLDKGWIHAPYNTVSADKTKYDAIKDPKFSELNQWVQECVNEFNDEVGFESMYPIDMWFNVYEKGDSQEFHNHPLSHLSCIYVAEGQEDDSQIFFVRPGHVSMFPIPCKTHKGWNYEKVWFPSKKGTLFVFKSDTLHMVEKKVTDTTRITFSWNFVCEN